LKTAGDVKFTVHNTHDNPVTKNSTSLFPFFLAKYQVIQHINGIEERCHRIQTVAREVRCTMAKHMVTIQACTEPAPRPQDTDISGPKRRRSWHTPEYHHHSPQHGAPVHQTKWDHKGMMETKATLRAAGTFRLLCRCLLLWIPGGSTAFAGHETNNEIKVAV